MGTRKGEQRNRRGERDGKERKMLAADHKQMMTNRMPISITNKR